MPLRLGIDISAIPYNRGISRYTANLVRALSKRKDLHMRVFGTSRGQYADLQEFCNKEITHVPHTLLKHPVKIMEVLWNRLHLVSPELLMGDMDVFHSWEMQPPLSKAALVSTIHDLAMLRFPKTADPYVLEMHQRSWKHLKKEAKAIIAVSHATKNDIVELLGIPQDKVHVVYEAIPDEARLRLTSVRAKELTTQLNITKPYIFFVGTLEPRKNVQKLIQAWRPLKKHVGLVLAGAQGWESIKQENDLKTLGVVSNEQLAALYNQAEVLAYPSLYEGFGLPILDGFYHKVPVVTSNISSMPEIAGDSAVLVDPHHVESIQEGLELAMKHRKTYVQKGALQLKKFSSWDRVATETMNVYERARSL